MTPQACPLRSHCFQCLGPIFALFFTSRIPFFSKNVKNVKIFCVVVAFKAESRPKRIIPANTYRSSQKFSTECFDPK